MFITFLVSGNDLISLAELMFVFTIIDEYDIKNKYPEGYSTVDKVESCFV